MLINPVARAAADSIGAYANTYRDVKARRWLRGNTELSIGASNGSLFIRLRRADGVTTQWDFTTQESIKDIRDMCDRVLEGKA